MADPEPTAIELETQELLRSIRAGEQLEQPPQQRQARRTNADAGLESPARTTSVKRRRRKRGRGEAGAGLRHSESEPMLMKRGATTPTRRGRGQQRTDADNNVGGHTIGPGAVLDGGGDSGAGGGGGYDAGEDPLAAVRRREQSFRDMPYEREQRLARQDAGSFVPAEGGARIDHRRLGADLSHFEEELERLEAIERVQDEARARAASNQKEGSRRRAWAGEDVAAVRAQRLYRGHLGRRRAVLKQQQRSIAAAWAEVRDAESGERWFYNVITNESSWEAPKLPWDVTLQGGGGGSGGSGGSEGEEQRGTDGGGGGGGGGDWGDGGGDGFMAAPRSPQEDDSPVQQVQQRPSTAPSLPPLSARSSNGGGGGGGTTPRKGGGGGGGGGSSRNMVSSQDLSPLVSRSVTQLPPVTGLTQAAQAAAAAQAQPPFDDLGGGGDDDLESLADESVADSEEMDGMIGSSTPRFFLADGSQNPRLRDTIASALRVSKYDSVSTLLAAGPAASRRGGGGGAAQGGGARRVAFGEKAGGGGGGKMVARMAGPSEGGGTGRKGARARRGGGKTAAQAGSSSSGGPPPVRDVANVGFELDDGAAGRARAGAEAAADGSADVGKAKTAGGAPAIAGDGRTKLTKEVCFGCWSASRGNCKMHAGAGAAAMKAEDSALLCSNWEVDALRRKYRSEEIQEIFMRQGKSLRYDKARKQFLTVVEMKHPIYRGVDQRITWENKRLWRKVHVQRWLTSFIDQLRVGKVPGTENMQGPKLMRLKNTLFNYRWVQRYTEAVQDDQPRPPITARLETREVKFCVCIDPDPPHAMLVHGGGEGQAFAPRFTRPIELFKPRVYELPAPRSIPMPEPSYAEEPPLPVPNKFVDEMENWSWFERLAARTAVQSCQMAMIQVEACTPPRGSSTLRRTKYPPPITIKFANFARKPNPPENKAVGGLCAELTVTQLVTTYVPPQFGGFTVTDRRAFAPTRNVVLEFLSLRCPAMMAKYVQRALEHVMNIRRAPTITCSTSARVATMIHHPQKEVDEGVLDEEGRFVYGAAAYELLVKHHNGDNRPEQTGETRKNGFRTTHPAGGLSKDSETTPLAFTPTVDVATPNLPSANRSETTHADRHYPFCEPSNRDNTTLDFFHLLLAGKSTRNQAQVFTTLGWQDPGLFAVKCDLDAPMGPCNSIVYRSWAFHQESPVEEFLTDDGTPYWYDRKSGETFWERPLLESETRRDVEDGGIDGTVVESVGEHATLGAGVETAPYEQGEIRKYMSKTLEDTKDVAFRQKALAQHIKESGGPGEVRSMGIKSPPKNNHPKAAAGGGLLEIEAAPAGAGGGGGGGGGDARKRRLSITGENLAVGTPKEEAAATAKLAASASQAAASASRGGGGGGGGGAAAAAASSGSSALVAASAAVDLPQDMNALVASISTALGSVLGQLGPNTGPQELLQLGLGLGMGLSSKHQGALATLGGTGGAGAGGGGSPSGKPKAAQSAHLPPVSTLYQGHGKEPGEDLPEDEAPPPDEAEARAAALRPGPTPDEVPLDAEYTTHPPAGLGTAFVEKPAPGMSLSLARARVLARPRACLPLASCVARACTRTRTRTLTSPPLRPLLSAPTTTTTHHHRQASPRRSTSCPRRTATCASAAPSSPRGSSTPSTTRTWRRSLSITSPTSRTSTRRAR